MVGVSLQETSWTAPREVQAALEKKPKVKAAEALLSPPEHTVSFAQICIQVPGVQHWLRAVLQTVVPQQPQSAVLLRTMGY